MAQMKDDPWFYDYEEDLEYEEFSKYEQTHPRAAEISTVLARKVNLSHRTYADVKNSEDKRQGKDRNQGRDDRATTEQVMDPRTRMILFKLLNRGVFEEIHGCVSTGKEANVYHATTASKEMELAVKVYKTSILVFKDRDKYVSGDHRFRSGYGRGNPRKMVRLWAEKELKNLNRLRTAGVPAPGPILLRGNVLVMEFLGLDGWPAPRLKDAELDDDRARSSYLQCIRSMRIMFRECRLVHGDLSEYNMLYWKKQVYIIDVSQSVELDHPRALDFLRVDCVNITRFFSSKLSNTLSARRLFEFVVNETYGVDEGEMDEALRLASEEQAKLSSQEMSAEQRLALQEKEDVRDKVFMESFIPRSLHQVDFEEMAEKEQNDDVSGTVAAVSKMTVENTRAEATEDSADSGSASDSSDHGEASAKKEAFKRSGTTKEERKVHKAAIKAEKAEQRKHKIKKKDKKLHRVPVTKPIPPSKIPLSEEQIISDSIPNT
jgi:RIO kinase 1